jgi:hypothetical protein
MARPLRRSDSRARRPNRLTRVAQTNVRAILANIEHATILAPSFVLGELEDALMVPWHSPASAGSRRPGGCWKAKDTNQTVTSVAFVCGFNDLGHFSRES